jgi:hypothetical protein
MYVNDVLEFCKHGEIGGVCGYGKCVQNVKCHCDEGYSHDIGWFYHPNCFVPSTFYTQTRILIGLIFLFVICYGFYVKYELQVKYPLATTHLQLVDSTIIFSIAWSGLILAHMVQGHWGILSHIICLVCVYIAAWVASPPIVQLYFYPVYKFAKSSTRATLNRLKICFTVCYLLLIGIFVELNRRVGFTFTFINGNEEGATEEMMLRSYSGWNDLIAWNMFVLSLFFLLAFVSLNEANNKAMIVLRKIQNGQLPEEDFQDEFHPNETDDKAINATTLSHQFREDNRESHKQLAQLHIDNLTYFRNFFEPMLIQAFSSLFAVFILHFASGGIFRYQYVIFIGATFPTPWVCLLLIRIGKTGGTNLLLSVNEDRSTRRDLSNKKSE